MEINLPQENKYLKNIRQADVLYDLLCPNGHPALTFVQEPLQLFEEFQEKWESVETKDPSKQPTKGVFHLQYLSLHLSCYWKGQSLFATPVDCLPDPGAMIGKIEVLEPWEPQLMSSLERQLRLPDFCRLFQKMASPSSTSTGPATTADASSIISALTSGSDLLSFLWELSAGGSGV